MEEDGNNKNVEGSIRKKPKSHFRKKRLFHRNLVWRSIKFNARKPKVPFREALKEKMETDKAREMKYSRGEPIDNTFVKVEGERKKFDLKEKNVAYALEQSVQSEILLTEEQGFMEVEEGETSEVRQLDILDVVDPCSAAKRFDLFLREYGPYRMSYTRNGRYLLLGGEKGHVAALDWIAKRLLCEVHVMESIHDVVWLHQETLYAVAQKEWLYVYDNQGIEIHCVKQISNVMRLEFLPYHFLLSAVSSNGWLSWLDVTIGTIVEQLHIPPHSNPATVAQHPGNALICIGQPSGVINFWSPNSKKPIVTKWCHKQPLCALAFDPKGQVLATASVDRMLKLWDARNLKGPTKHYKLNNAPNWITFSESGLMAFGTGHDIEIYKDNVVGSETQKKLYLTYEVVTPIKNMQFCALEDVLGIAHGRGFSSILVPGSGEPNFDALETNPFQTKAQRREREVHDILSKIPPELITWDPTELRKVHVPSLEEEIEEKNKVGYVKPSDIHIEPRYKTGKKAKSTGLAKRKKIMKEELRKNRIKSLKEAKDAKEASGAKEKEGESSGEAKPKKKSSVLDRFKPKTTK